MAPLGGSPAKPGNIRQELRIRLLQGGFGTNVGLLAPEFQELFELSNGI